MTGRTLLVPDTSGAPRRHESGSSALRAAGTLWLVRHGESGWNVARRIQGQSPAAPGLTATGRSQAAEAALELARRAPRANRIVASDLPRTAETAEIIAARLGLPVEFDAGLREQSLGVLEGRSVFAAAGADGADGADGAGRAGGAEGSNGADSVNEASGAKGGGGAADVSAEADGADRAAENGAAEGGAADERAEHDLLYAFWEDPFRTPPGGESVADMYDRVPSHAEPDHRGLPASRPDRRDPRRAGPRRRGRAPAGARPGVPAHRRGQRVHHALSPAVPLTVPQLLWAELGAHSAQNSAHNRGFSPGGTPTAA